MRIGVNETLVHSNRVLTSTMACQQDKLGRMYAIIDETGEWEEVLLERPQPSHDNHRCHQ